MNAITEKPHAVGQWTPRPRLAPAGAPPPAAAVASGGGAGGGHRHWRHRLVVVHRGALHREHRQRLCPGRHRRPRTAHRGRCGRHQGGRQPARACRRPADRARSGRLAGASGAGDGCRRRGDRRDRDGAAPGGAAAGNHPGGAVADRPGAGRAGEGGRRCVALGDAGIGRLGLAAGQRPGDRRCAQGERRRGLGGGAEGGGGTAAWPCCRRR